MKLIREIFNLPPGFSGCVVTIGNFDGVHLGHQQLVQRLIEKSLELKQPSLVITFEPQPNEFFAPGKTPARLMRLREKLIALQDLGVNYVLGLRFNAALAQLSAEDFIKTILVEHLQASFVLVGDDFRFGAKREGNIELLKQRGPEYHFQAQSMPTFIMEGRRVSSSQVRMALEAGDLTKAQQFMGRRYGISGKVAHGDKRGRIIGFPTANLFLHRKAVPVQGVYVVLVHGLGEIPIEGVANVGNRPTIDGTRSLLEVHLFNFNRDIYGQHIYVEFIHKLRDEIRYPNFDLLRQQILKDAEEAKAYLQTQPPPLKKGGRGGI